MAFSLKVTSALLILYSLQMAVIILLSSFVSGTAFVMAKPPFSFFFKMIAGGFWFKRMPKPSNSFSMMRSGEEGTRGETAETQ